MSTRDEDQAWRAIVENYGDRAVLDEGPEERASETLESPEVRETIESAEIDPHDPGQRPRPFVSDQGHTSPFVGAHIAPDEGRDEGPDDVADRSHEARFVPPDPPLPKMEPRRWIAWLCVLGSPVLFVLCAILDTRVTGLVAAVLALCFVGGFAWLVASMPKEPRDPWDDGSRV